MSKKEQIAETALHLFAAQGVDGTSTRAIATDAGVSEALIFRHFTSKDGLVAHLFSMLTERFAHYDRNAPEDPTAYIRYWMELPLQLEEEDEKKFWILLYQQRWNNGTAFTAVFESLRSGLIRALNSLHYPRVDAEADLILSYIHGLAIACLGSPSADPELLLQALRSKYIRA